MKRYEIKNVEGNSIVTHSTTSGKENVMKYTTRIYAVSLEPVL